MNISDSPESQDFAPWSELELFAPLRNYVVGCWVLYIETDRHNFHCVSKHWVWSLGGVRLIAVGVYPGFCSMKQLGVFLLPLDGMLVRRGSLSHNLLGFPNNLLELIYTPGWREALWELSVLPKNTTNCPRPGLKPGPLSPWKRALTIRPLHLPQASRRELKIWCITFLVLKQKKKERNRGEP